MATVLRQLTIWQELQQELPPGLQELRAFLSALSQFDGELVHKLQAERGRGRDDLPVPAMFNALATHAYLRHSRFADLLAELRRNNDLARLLGFREDEPGQYVVPSKSAFTRFHGKLKADTCFQDVRRIFERTVEALRFEHPEFGKHQALDSSDVRTHARPPRRDPEDESGERRLPSSDPEAGWSVKTKMKKGKDGQPRKEVKKTFGYKFYASVDTSIPAILAVDVSTGSASDQVSALAMIREAKARAGGRMETVAMDKGFDSEANVVGAYDEGIAAIVPVREVPAELKNQPQRDREKQLVAGGNLVFDPYTGEVACYAPQDEGSDLERRVLKHAGFERDRESHKFRCPLGAVAATQCKAFASCSAGSSGSQGRQIRVEMSLDARRLAPVYPRSKRWKRLYNGRSAVERINSYLKEVLRLERHCLRGKRAIELRVLLAATTLNLRTLLSLRGAAAVATAA